MLIISRKCFNVVKNYCRCISNSVIDVLPEIQACLTDNKPIVALESTIITHGMPYPANLDTAIKCQEIIRNEGCVPAVIAVLNGRVKVGLTDDQLKYLAKGGSGKTIKTSRRDFPYVLANGLDGGTTVSGTVIVASSVGIKVFATGGIGGVHRKGEDTLDISADLIELGRNPIMVVSSGIKSILDIGKTLEFLETQGVLVSTFGSDRSMPAFFSRNSAFKAPYNVNTAEEGAALIHGITDMNYNSGILLAVPIPHEHSIDYELMESHINKALKDADNKGVVGKEITPYLLEKINTLTKGKSLKSNIALIENNSSVAAKIAYSYYNQKNRINKSSKHSVRSKNPVVIGGSVLDCTVKLNNKTVFDGRTVNGTVEQFCGGVGRNLADCLGKLGSKPSFISLVGDDRNGATILKSLSHIDCKSVEILTNENTASYMVLLDEKGDCILCVGNSDIHLKTDVSLITKHIDKIDYSNFVILDTNIPEDAMEFILDYASKLSIPVWVEPTSLLKCHKLLACPTVNSVNYISPNLTELKQMAVFLGNSFDEEFSDNVDKLLEQVTFLSRSLILKVPATLMITLGKFGTLVVDGQSGLNDKRTMGRYYPALTPKSGVVNSSGAGDCGAAGFISGILRGLPEAECIYLAHSASCASLLSKSAVPDHFKDLTNDVPSSNFITVPVI